MRRPEPLDPAVERELADLDAALAGAPDADAELALLVREVRAAAPRLDAAARERLDARAAAAAAPAKRARPWRLPRLQVLAPALGVVAAALVAVVLVGRTGDGDESSSKTAVTPTELQTGSGGGSSASGTPAAPPADVATSGTAAPAPSLAAPSARPTAGRRVERTVTLSLGTTAARFDAVTDGVVRATQRAGGFVSESSTQRSRTRGTATFVLRIPTARLDAAVASLSRLAHVRSIEQATTDLTGATDGTTGRLRDARTQRRAIVAALATASGARADRLRARLRTVTAHVRALERSLRALRARTTYATVELTVTRARTQAAAPGTDHRWTPADALRDARRALELAAGVAIVALALLLPLALLGGAAAIAGRGLRRRRREGALDLV
jgi:hypothetical protein